MPAHLSCKQGSGLLHLAFDERVSGLPHDRVAAVCLYVVVEALGALDLSDDCGPFVFLEYVAGEDDHQPVAPDDRAVLVNNAYAVCVSVISYPAVSAGLLDLCHKVFEVLLHHRVRVVVGESPVRLAEQLEYLRPKGAHEGRAREPASAVSGVHNDLQAAQALETRLDVLDILGDDVMVAEAPLARDRGAFFRQLSHVLYLCAVDGLLAHREFKAVIFRGVVASCDHYAAIQAMVVDGEILHRRGDHPDVHNVYAACGEFLGEGLVDGRGTEPYVMAYAHCRPVLANMLFKVYSVSTAYSTDRLCREVLLPYASYIVFTEYPGFKHADNTPLRYVLGSVIRKLYQVLQGYVMYKRANGTGRPGLRSPAAGPACSWCSRWRGSLPWARSLP